MAAQRRRKLSFLPQPAADPAVGYGSFPLEIGVGELLRMTRERQGQELQSVANQLRIRLAYLQAIEDARFRDLPGSTYAVGFVRSYADYLGLDGGDVVRRFREEAARVHGRPKLVFPAVSAEGKIPGAAVLLLSAVGAAIVYGAWYYLSSSEDRDLQLIAEVPDRLVALPPGETSPGEPVTLPVPTGGDATSGTAGASATPPAGAPAEHGASATAQASEALDVSPPSDEGPVTPDPDASVPMSPPVADATAGAAPSATAGAEAPPAPEQPQAALATVPSAGSSAPGSEPTASGPTASGPTESAAPAADAASSSIPAAPPAPTETVAAPQQEAALPPGEKGIVLEARLDSWIQIVDGKGQTVVDRILRAGERYVVPAGTGLVLTTGNAGGLDMFVDGQRTPPLGDVGAVKRKISLDSGQLRQGNATE
jgi:cytoskeleton protein RodZ